MQYRSLWPIFILKSKVVSHWLVQIWWWPTSIMGSKVTSHWLIIQKLNFHPTNSLQDVRQNYWTVKYRSWWLSLHDTQVNVIRLTYVCQSTSINCLNNRKAENHFLRCPRFWPLAPPGAWTLGSSHGMKAEPQGYLWSKCECFLMTGCQDMNFWKTST